VIDTRCAHRVPTGPRGVGSPQTVPLLNLAGCLDWTAAIGNEPTDQESHLGPQRGHKHGPAQAPEGHLGATPSQVDHPATPPWCGSQADDRECAGVRPLCTHEDGFARLLDEPARLADVGRRTRRGGERAYGSQHSPPVARTVAPSTASDYGGYRIPHVRSQPQAGSPRKKASWGDGDPTLRRGATGTARHAPKSGVPCSNPGEGSAVMSRAIGDDRVAAVGLGPGIRARAGRCRRLARGGGWVTQA
jgi:hypothetical protein